MNVLRFLGLPNAVRHLILFLVAVVVFTASPFSKFTTADEASKYMLPFVGTVVHIHEQGFPVGKQC